MPLIKLDSVSYTYKGSPTAALDSVSLEVEAGEYVAIVGANGSGKSTLLRLLNGLYSASSGAVTVAGLDAALSTNARAIRSTVSLVFQSPPDQIVATVVEEDVAFGPENLGLPRAQIEARVTEALEAVGLLAERRRPPHFLSAGQQQRLAVAGALAMRSRCVAFDEATAMLDPPARESVLDLMDDLVARGDAVIHATHDMTEAARARRLVALDAGRVIYDGEPEAFFAASCAGGESDLPCIVAPPALRLARVLGIEGAARDRPEELARAALRSGALSVEEGGPGSAAEDSLRGAASTEPAFELDRVSYSYLRGTANQSSALSGVTLAVPRGSVLALVGRTGSGKSTLLQLLDALAFPSSGRVLSFGSDTSAPDAPLRALRMRSPLAVQRPESALFEAYAGDDVAFGPRNLGLSGKELVERVRAAMERVGLGFAEFRDRRTRALSGGEKRLLALAGVMALEPEALLLDEPTAALDPAMKTRILHLIFGFASEGRTVVLATHSMEEAAMADLVGVLVGGRLAALGPPRRIFYDEYDPGWGIGRPFACDFVLALRAAGASFPEKPLTVDALADIIGERVACGVGPGGGR